MIIAPQIRGANIVAIGLFNPMIFRPDWFRDKEIIVGSDYAGIKIDIIHADVVNFKLPWGQVSVDRDRFTILTTQEPLIRVYDFFVKSFQFLPETPIKAVGINHEIHFDSSTREAFDHIGDTLAPKPFWGDFVNQDGKRVGGMRTIIMEQGLPSKGGGLERLDGSMGFTRARVEPSVLVPPHGVFVQINDHFDLARGDQFSDGQRAAELVAEKWDRTLQNAENLVDRIMGLVDVR